MRAILLIDHGSRRDHANAMLEKVAVRLRERLKQSADAETAQSAQIVQIAHMELASPSIAEGFAACVAAGATEVVAHPYFLAPGRHVTEDIPRLLAEAASHYPDVVTYLTEPLGLHDGLIDAVIDRAQHAKTLDWSRALGSDGGKKRTQLL